MQAWDSSLGWLAMQAWDSSLGWLAMQFNHSGLRTMQWHVLSATF